MDPYEDCGAEQDELNQHFEEISGKNPLILAGIMGTPLGGRQEAITSIGRESLDFMQQMF